MYTPIISSDSRYGGAGILASKATLVRRDEDQGDKFKSQTVTIVLAVVVTCFVAFTIISLIVVRRLRFKNKDPRFGPFTALRRKWQALLSRSKYSQVNSRDRARDLSTTNTAYNGGVVETEERAAVQAEAAGVDRNTSVRSVITLPAYSMAPKETEQVIGREGERAGMDTVVEFPENADEEEAHREEDMEALYQIRLARRREVAERDQRRQQRREARERGDWARLEELRRESRARASAPDLTSTANAGQNLSAAALLAEHQSRGRDRRVSEVSYGSLGQVRHDGSRLRANSDDSERGGLLRDAAPMASNDVGPVTSFDGASTHSNPNQNVSSRARGQSDTSIRSISTAASDMEETRRQQTLTSVRPSDQRTPSIPNEDSGTSNSSPTANRFTPDESTGSDDIGESRIPITSVEDTETHHHQPPDYDFLEWGDAPAYDIQHHRRNSQRDARQGSTNITRQVPSQAPQLPHLNLPQINVEGATEPNTPVTSSTTGMTLNEDHH